MAAGLAAGFLLREPQSSSAHAAASPAAGSYRISKREPLMSAADLDGQQPTAAVSVASQARPVSPTAGAGWSYRNCREARAAGAAPLYRGQPGYGAHMDGDHDGIACEPYPP